MKSPGRDLAPHRHGHADSDDDHKPQPDKKEEQRAHRRRVFYEPYILRGVFAVELLKLLDLGILLRVGANDPHPAQIFLRPGGNIGEKSLDLLEPRVDLLSEIFYGERYERHRYQQHNVSFTEYWSSIGRQIQSAKIAWKLYRIIGPTICRMAARSLVARAMRSPTRLL